MSVLVLIFYMVSIAISCMALGLAIASAIERNTNWNTWCIVFQSCLIFSMVVGYLLVINQLFMPPTVEKVLTLIFRLMQHATIGFVSVILPFLTSFIVKEDWGKKKRLTFYPLGIIYALAGLFEEMTGVNVYTNVIQTVIFCGVLIHCVVTLWKNLGKIDDKRTRNFIRAMNIVVICLVPTSILVYFYPPLANLGYPFYVFSFSVLLLVFFFIRFNAERENLDSQKGLTDEELSQYRITEREMEVVRYICKGMTNKEIAYEMKISVNTVNNHVANIFDKMNVSSRIELIRTVKGSLWD